MEEVMAVHPAGKILYLKAFWSVSGWLREFLRDHHSLAMDMQRTIE